MPGQWRVEALLFGYVDMSGQWRGEGDFPGAFGSYLLVGGWIVVLNLTPARKKVRHATGTGYDWPASLHKRYHTCYNIEQLMTL